MGEKSASKLIRTLRDSIGAPTKPTDRVTELDRVLAVPMFLAAVLFLLIAGFLIHTQVGDAPQVQIYSPTFRMVCLTVLGLLYLLLIMETIAHFFNGSRNMRQHLWNLVFPFCRLCSRDHVDGSHAWVVGIGWRRTTPIFEEYLTRIFSGPMMFIALMVLPVMVAEYFYAKTITRDPVWGLAIQTAAGFIWMAFVFEFVIMITVVRNKMRYCKKNWIDLAVIALPLVAFMPAARLGKLMKLQQLSKTAKIYRMRGLALRTWRAVVALDIIDTLLRRDPNHRVEKFENLILEKHEEIKLLRNDLERARQRAKRIEQRRLDCSNHRSTVTTSNSEMRFCYSKSPPSD